MNATPPLLDEPPRRADPAVELAAEKIGRMQSRGRGLLALFFVLLGLFTLHDFLPALAWGCIFAVISWPAYRRAQRGWAWGDTSLAALFTAAIALIFLTPLSIIGLEAAHEAQNVLDWLELIRQRGAPVPPWLPRLPMFGAQAVKWWQDHMVHPDDVADLLHSVDALRSMAMTRRLGGQVAHRGILFLFSIATLFFLLRDGRTVTKRCLIGSHRLFGHRGESLARQMISAVHGVVAGLVLVGLGEGFVMGTAYVFAGAPQPLLFGGVTAVAAMIPFLAVPSIALVSALILVQGSVIGGISVLCLGLFVIFVADHFIRPALIGGSTQMPFLWVLLGILGGVETWGLLGLFLGPAILAALHLLWRNWTEGEPPDRQTSPNAA
ncbi:AI-2E family transporter [Tanticharoenia sakaeratensis]|jgi:predicted PurR-regulated permease PerM|uniref:Permease n=1 Tax=Tanticharoenia sakaeratensis NBRC 103193 TaxID=1231623 RepID=A0A0D6MP68_9PROT|nr:AI-2E family transporter [Tanticharoenia sakaeratensis]GAN55083.1 permease [Tanticharoenia sakaeratensis NBRC 103193]GBQ20168.1 permease [Tanticharoenia sakaeratensis NBRC 103193]